MAGVSTATVSRVLNDDSRISASTYELVQQVIQDSGYRRNSVARNLKTSRTQTVGFLTPEIANDFFMHIAEGVEEGLQRKGYSLIICNTAEDAHVETRRIDLLSEQRIAGLIIIPSGRTGDHFRVLDERKIPAVVVDRLVEGFDCDGVLVDNVDGSFRAARRLFEAGVRRIGFIGGRPDLTTARERWEGFCRAHREFHIPLDESLVRFGDFHIDSGFHLTRELISLPHPPRHLFIANYFMHLGATRYLLESGTGSSLHIQTAGFDDMDLVPLLDFSSFTISQPMRQMGSTAAELLLARLEGTATGPARIERLATGFTVHRQIIP